MSERLRRFLLATTPGPACAAVLAPEDLEHARRVLRLSAGDRIEGIDGRGHAWELELGAFERRGVPLRVLRELPGQLRPGEPGASLPWIEVAASLPKGARAEELVGRLAQLGVARLVPLVAGRSAEAAREFGGHRRVRLERLAAEALKQSGRLWSLEIAEPLELAQLLALAERELLLLSPRTPERFFDWTAAQSGRNWSAERPLCLVAGPEGGFSALERAGLLARGARELWLGPHVLRIETACEAAAAVLAAGLGRAPAAGPGT
ncbi:MAG: RsmE family RNA methyltransferase [Planctomycetes bacterium]|nr:RsmE family RNA methyltransferase [Planctomycetota bacterium]